MGFGKNNNGLLQSLLLVLFIIAILAAYSFFFKESSFLQRNFKDLPQVAKFQINLTSQYKRINKQQIKNAFTYNVAQEEAALMQAKLDSIKAFESYTGENKLYFFIQALKNADKKTARIAYLGDSSIEGDLISMTLRKLLQKEFGGQGVGFVPITSQTAGFRTTVGHRFSNNWSYASIIKSNPTDFPYGFSGEIFYATPDTTATEPTSYSVNYTARQANFPKAKLFYGKSDSLVGASNYVIYQGEKIALTEKNSLNELLISNQSQRKIDLEFSINHSLPFYGMSFESNTGVLVDNYSSRSNSGIPLTKITGQMLQAYDEIMDYDLVILQFGLNALSKNGEDKYGWYKQSMKRVIAHYKQAMPTTNILLVSVGDRGEKNDDGEMQTAASIENMIAAQRETARESDVAFFNFYEAMGGKNSMVEWVEELEQANKDYTHLNYKGSRIIGTKLYQFLLNAYENYEWNDEQDVD